MSCVFGVDHWCEDSTNIILARVTALDASGAEVDSPAEEGSYLTQVDVSTITYSVFDKDSATPDTAIDSGSLTISDVIFDTVQTKGWKKDAYGYNFRHDLGPTAFPTGNRREEIEYKFTLADGTVFHGVFKAPVIPIRTS